MNILLVPRTVFPTALLELVNREVRVLLFPAAWPPGDGGIATLVTTLSDPSGCTKTLMHITIK